VVTVTIGDDKAGIARSNELSNEALGGIQQALTSLEEAQGMLMQVTEGSGRPEFSEAAGLLGQAISELGEVSQQVSGAIQSADGGAAAL
jgi:hypothetical protein